MNELDDIVTVAEAAARRAGAIQMEKYGGLLNVDAKLASDIKLEADRLCEAAMLEEITKRFPSHAVLAEESGAAEGADCVWYVDPLDGTVNFYHGLPYFCTTLACYRKTGGGGSDLDALGKPLVGVTYSPIIGEMFTAIAGRGLTLNGRRVRIREEQSLSEALCITSIGNDPEVLGFTERVTLRVCRRIRKARNLGARAYDIANAACGRASGYFEYRVKAWDIAAGKIQVEEAGGRFSLRQCPDGNWVGVASGKNIHDELVKLVMGYLEWRTNRVRPISACGHNRCHSERSEESPLYCGSVHKSIANFSIRTTV